jgi:putative endonuclease
MTKKEVGNYGEKLAARFLETRGFKIIERNFLTRWGEIDLVCERAGVLHFVEVKTRSVPDYGQPEEAIHWRKRERLLGTAKMYLVWRGSKCLNYQIDSVSVFINLYRRQAKIRYLANILLEK